MKTPAALVDWLTEKTEVHPWAGVREVRTVDHLWRRHTGGRIMSAALSVSVAPSREFSIEVRGSTVLEYCAAAKNGVVSVLLSQSWAPVLRCQIVLNLEPHEEESSYAAFFAAAREATEQLLGVRGEFTHNISCGKHGA